MLEDATMASAAEVLVSRKLIAFMSIAAASGHHGD